MGGAEELIVVQRVQRGDGRAAGDMGQTASGGKQQAAAAAAAAAAARTRLLVAVGRLGRRDQLADALGEAPVAGVHVLARRRGHDVGALAWPQEGGGKRGGGKGEERGEKGEV